MGRFFLADQAPTWSCQLHEIRTLALKTITIWRRSRRSQGQDCFEELHQYDLVQDIRGVNEKAHLMIMTAKWLEKK